MSRLPIIGFAGEDEYVVFRSGAMIRTVGGSFQNRVALTLAHPPEDPSIALEVFHELLHELLTRLNVSPHASGAAEHLRQVAQGEKTMAREALLEGADRIEHLELNEINLVDGVNYWHERCIQLEGG